MNKHEVLLGKLIEDEQFRDAIHIAVVPAIASQKLSPGQDVGFTSDDKSRVGVAEKTVGIVDPFLKNLIFPDQKFWLLLYPQTITSLRHEWTHPEFDQPVVPAISKEAAVEWMKSFALEANLSFDEVIDAARDFLVSGDYLTQYDEESARDAMFNHGTETFWKYYEIVTGEKVKDEDKDGSVFSCSC